MINSLFDFLKKNLVLDYFLDFLKWKKYMMLKNVPDKKFAEDLYFKKTGKKLNLNKPTTFDEKLWFLKINNKDPLLTICTDKHLVRDYVKKVGLENILIESYESYESADEIDFNNFPDKKVFLKCNHTSGYNVIYDKDKNFNKKWFVRKFNFVLSQNHYWLSREWNYKNIKPRIISEKLLPIDNNSATNGNLGLIDYKFLCFEGKVEGLFVDIDVSSDTGSHNRHAKRNFYDKDFNFLDVKITREQFDRDLVEKPANFDLMKNYAEILSEPFPFCRVDLYNINGDIYFGEMTFYHNGGINQIYPSEWDYKLGGMINLNSSKIKY